MWLIRSLKDPVGKPLGCEGLNVVEGVAMPLMVRPLPEQARDLRKHRGRRALWKAGASHHSSLEGLLECLTRESWPHGAALHYCVCLALPATITSWRIHCAALRASVCQAGHHT